MIRIDLVQGVAPGRFHHPGPHVTIGRAAGNDLVLTTDSVSRRHVEVREEPDGMLVINRSAQGVFVNGQWMDGLCMAASGAVLQLGEVLLRVEVHSDAVLLPEDEAGDPTPITPPGRPLEVGAGQPITVPPLLMRRLHQALIDRFDLRDPQLARMSDLERRTRADELLEQLLPRFEGELEGLDRARLKKEVLDEALGLGPLEDLLGDERVSEIMVVSRDLVFVEREGRLTEANCRFSSDEALLAVIERIVTPLGRRIDEASPLVDARLKDGSRVNAVIAPLALKGPCLTIRKFGHKRLEMADLVRFGALSQSMATFLERCVRGGKNLVISGGTGSGKTTLLNVLSGCIPEDERVVTIEDAAELRLVQRHVVSLETRPTNMEGRGAVTMRDLVRNALRMRPDRIVVGECRGGEALDMLQAMNTGHDGSLTTAHANTPEDMVARLETMVLMAGMDLPLRAVRTQIASAVNLVVQIRRFEDGSRKVTHITEVLEVDEDGRVRLEDVFRFEEEGRDARGKVLGQHRMTGYLPSFLETLIVQGLIPEGDYL